MISLKLHWKGENGQKQTNKPTDTYDLDAISYPKQLSTNKWAVLLMTIGHLEYQPHSIEQFYLNMTLSEVVDLASPKKRGKRLVKDQQNPC